MSRPVPTARFDCCVAFAASSRIEAFCCGSLGGRLGVWCPPPTAPRLSLAEDFLDPPASPPSWTLLWSYGAKQRAEPRRTATNAHRWKDHPRTGLTPVSRVSTFSPTSTHDTRPHLASLRHARNSCTWCAAQAKGLPFRAGGETLFLQRSTHHAGDQPTRHSESNVCKGSILSASLSAATTLLRASIRARSKIDPHHWVFVV